MIWWSKNRAVLAILAAVALAAVLLALAGETRFPIPQALTGVRPPLATAYFLPVIVAVAVNTAISRASRRVENRSTRPTGLLDAGLALAAIIVFAAASILCSAGITDATQIGIRSAAALTGLTLICAAVTSIELASIPPIVYLLAAALFGGTGTGWAWITAPSDSAFALLLTGISFGVGLIITAIRWRPALATNAGQ